MNDSSCNVPFIALYSDERKGLIGSYKNDEKVVPEDVKIELTWVLIASKDTTAESNLLKVLLSRDIECKQWPPLCPRDIMISPNVIIELKIQIGTLSVTSLIREEDLQGGKH